MRSQLHGQVCTDSVLTFERAVGEAGLNVQVDSAVEIVTAGIVSDPCHGADPHCVTLRGGYATTTAVWQL